MFKFLKEKLKAALGKFSKKVEEEVEVEEKEVEVREERRPIVKKPAEKKPELTRKPEPAQRPEKRPEPAKRAEKEKELEKKTLPEKKPEQKAVEKPKAVEEKPLKQKPEKAKKPILEKKPIEEDIEKEIEEEIKEEEEEAEAAEEKLEKLKKEIEEEEHLVEEEEEDEKQIEAGAKGELKKGYDIWYGKEEEKKGFFKRLFTRKKEEEKRKRAEEEDKKKKEPFILKEIPEEETIRKEKPAVFHVEVRKPEEKKPERKPEPAKPERAEEESAEAEQEVEEAEERVEKRKKQAEALEQEDAQELEEEVKEEEQEKEKAQEEIAEEERPSFFKKITERFTKFSLSEEKFEEIFWELEVVLMENNVAVEVIQKIKDDLKEELTQNKISRKNVEDTVIDTLKHSIEDLFKVEKIDLIKEARKKKPYIIAFIGVNGSGKTTTLAKVAKLFLDNKMTPVIAASDTFRAAAIQQLEEHADRLGVKLIKQDYKADPAAVAFDAIEHAKAKKLDVVLIDTAGRLHSNDNLMNELKKLIRVNKPDLKIFVGESITGNDCVEQCKLFDEAVGIDAIILAKADVDEKGGAAVSVSYVTGKPIIYMGVGQKYEDLKKFEPEIVLENLGLD
ncbi:MAG: signal recognition particle-docking protein FtsY [Nanoarchaeota archaeon]